MTDHKSLTITRHLQCPMTPAEKSEKHEQLVRTLNDLERIEEHFAGIREQHKANVKSRQVTIKELTHDLGAGFVMRPIACEQVPDLPTNRMLTKRMDTGEQIDERALTVDELKRLAQGKTV